MLLLADGHVCFVFPCIFDCDSADFLVAIHKRLEALLVVSQHYAFLEFAFVQADRAIDVPRALAAVQLLSVGTVADSGS